MHPPFYYDPRNPPTISTRGMLVVFLVWMACVALVVWGTA